MNRKWLELVGWCTEQQYKGEYPTNFADGAVPATVVWNPDDMVETAMTRLAVRREQPDLPPMLFQVGVRLCEPR